MSEKNIKKATVFDVANWFLSKEAMTPKKLQKLVYYAYAWFLTLNNEDRADLNNKLFDEKFQAWVHGPVCPKLYKEYKKYGYQDIPLKNKKLSFKEDIKEFLEKVWNIYGGFSADELESISHQESPWINARQGCHSFGICTEELKDEEIFDCYVERL